MNLHINIKENLIFHLNILFLNQENHQVLIISLRRNNVLSLLN